MPTLVATVRMNVAQASSDELGWMTQVDWTLPFLGLCAAIAVLWLGRKLSQGAFVGRRKVQSKGRDLDFDLEIARLENQSPVEIASAKRGLVHLRGVLKSAQGTLGGPPEQARVWYNQCQAPKDAAVGVELCLMGDNTGQVALEDLSQARVIAPTQGEDPRFRALALGDRVEVLGEFIAEKVRKGDEADSEQIYGVIGRGRTFQIRLLERPEAQNPSSESPTRQTD